MKVSETKRLTTEFGLRLIGYLFFQLDDEKSSAKAAGQSGGELPSEETTTSKSSHHILSTKTEKYDPYNMLREIYLGHDSKVITMLMPEEGSETGNASFQKKQSSDTDTLEQLRRRLPPVVWPICLARHLQISKQQLCHSIALDHNMYLIA